ncbi:FHA domain-containing protein [Pendulispora albinea]|uniref:FHA domain-containing protein n=1 Tax=Pendulispora albinea TaxID=2741071 RepID=A0ABZ2LXV5_9BACT
MPLTIVVRTPDSTPSTASTPPSKEAKGAPSQAAPAEASSSPSLTFDGPRIVIGRGTGCDVRLPDVSVSHRHASLRIDAGVHTLIDEGSLNGTFVGGVRLLPQVPRVIQSGDLVRVGRVWLELKIDQRPATRDLSMATRDLALRLVSQAMSSLGDSTVAKIVVVEGRSSGAFLHLEEEGRLYIVGRGDACDLTLDERDASREHLQIVRRGSVVLVRDLDSKNGVFIGEIPLERDRDMVWKSSSMVRVGTTVLALHEPVADALADLEAAPDEKLVPADVPPQPLREGHKSDAPISEIPASSSLRAEDDRSSAPIASVAKIDEPAPTKKKPSPLTPGYAFVVITAFAVIVASLLGLVWLLRSSEAGGM